jgi:hypothetical protein
LSVNAAEAAALASIDAVFEETVIYTGGGLTVPTPIPVVWSDMPGESFQGAGNTTRTITAEIRYSLLAQRPAKADRIARDGKLWKPIQVADRDEMARWVVTLEQTAS